jgi:adenylate kinase family enzyme
MNRIVVIGNAASGKSTFSMKLQKITSIPVFHLDKILWKADWERTPEEEFTIKHNKILEQSRWIIDGVAYKSTYEKRFEASDTIIFLDTPLEICKERALQRMHEDLERPNPYVTEGCRYPLELVKEQNEVIDMFHNDYRTEIIKLITKYEDSKSTYHLVTDKDANQFLEMIKH